MNFLITDIILTVMFAIEQSLLSMATHPDIHFEAVNYLQQMSSTMAEKCEATASRHYSEEAVAMFERSIKSFMKTNMLMYFAYADYEEVTMNIIYSYLKIHEIKQFTNIINMIIINKFKILIVKIIVFSQFNYL